MSSLTPLQLQIRKPVVLIRVNGELSSDLMNRLVHFRYTDRIHKRDTCTMTIDNRDGRLQLDPNSVWEVRWGRWGRLGPIRALTIKTITEVFDADIPAVGVELQATRGRTNVAGRGTMPSSEMHRVRIAKNWGKIPSSKIAKAIAKRHRLKAVVEDSEDVDDTPFLQSSNLSDYEYLNQLAHDIDFEFFIEGDTLYYRPQPFDERPTHTLFHAPVRTDTYLLSFTPEIKVSKVSVKASSASGPKGKDGKLLESFEDLEKDGLRMREAAELLITANTADAVMMHAQKELDKAHSDYTQVSSYVEHIYHQQDADPLLILRMARQANILSRKLQKTMQQYDRDQANVVRLIEDTKAEVFKRRTEPPVVADPNCAEAKTEKKTPTGEHAGQKAVQWSAGDERFVKTISIGQPLGSAAVPEGVAQEQAAVETTIDTPEMSKKKRKRVACAALARYTARAVEAQAVVIGDRDFRAKANYAIAGIPRHTGAWYAKEAVTEISSDYVVTLSLRRGSLGKISKKKAADTDKKDKKDQEEAPKKTVREFSAGNARWNRVVTQATSRP